MPLPGLRKVLFDDKRVTPQPSERPGWEWFDEVAEPLIITEALFTDPNWLRQPFIQRLLDERAKGEMPDGTYVEVQHGHLCPYSASVPVAWAETPIAERALCTCSRLIFVHDEMPT